MSDHQIEEEDEAGDRRVIELLHQSRPRPDHEFADRLRQDLLESSRRRRPEDAGRRRKRRAAMPNPVSGLTIATYGGLGCFLLAFATIGVAGIGPLAA